METTLSIEMADKLNKSENENSIAKAIKKYGSQIGGFIKSKVSNRDEAQDILQEVWFQLSRLTNLEEIENMSGWLHRVSRNKITDFYRKKKPDSLEEYTESDDDRNFSLKEVLLMDTSNNPELEVFKELFWDEFEKALDELPEKQREVFVWNELEDQTLQGIADKLEISIKTVISRKGYAVKFLRERLKYLYEELND
ncbi:MAG: sigma-70 family RNA polymerase sigma factor [Crocinitomicaceae bacterium]|nr:sigma-70 family RNA polymerase sigma factor [Crocinitomicaceae bacterium]